MKKFLQKKLKDQKGMTLIELLAVIVIIAIIAAIAIPAIGSLIDNSRNGAVKSDYQNALAAANIYFTEKNATENATVTVEVLAGKVNDTDGTKVSYLDDKGSLDDKVIITKKTGGNTIAGGAGEGTTVDSTTTYPYNISSGLTNSQLSKIPNKSFKGTITATTGQ